MATQGQLTREQLGKGFSLDEWRIWPNAGQIEKDGVKTHIEPKLVEVLLLLAQAPGQVVGREELLEQAWRRQVVCDEALTRAISELRALLGDTNRTRCYIRTIPKRGYSLIADVSLLNPEPMLVSEHKRTDYQGLANSAAWIPAVSFTNRLIKYWLYGVGSLTTGLGALVALTLLLAENVTVNLTDDGLMGNSAQTFDLADTRAMNNEIVEGNLRDVLATPSLAPIKNYAVLPFTNLTPEQELGFFTQGLEEDIRTALASLKGAQVAGRIVSNQFHPSAINNTSTGIQEIANRLNVDAIVDGTVRLIDGQVRVTVQLLNGKTGFPLWSKRYDKAFERILVLQTHISKDMICELESRMQKIQLVTAGMQDEALIETEREIKALSLGRKGDDYGRTRLVEWLLH